MKRCALTFLILHSAFCISFASGPWTQKASYGGPGRHRPFSLVINNHAYIGGGWNGMTMWFDFWEYDPATNTWTQRANTPTSMWTATGFGLAGKGHVVVNSTHIVYDPVANSWTNGPPDPLGIFWESEAWIYNNKAYMPNGSQVEEYNPVTNSWTVINTFGYSNGGWGTGFQTSTKFYDISGNVLYELNPTNWQWTQKATFPGENRSQCCGIGAQGKGYYGCGDGFVSNNLNDWWEYNPATNTWKEVDPLPGSTRENFTTFAISNKAYLACGTNGINLQDVWEFDPANITGVQEEENNVSVNVYPNPMFESATIEVSSQQLAIGKLEFELYDLQGKLVRKSEIENPKSEITRGNLKAETYLYQVSSEGKSISSGKLVVQ